MSRSRRLASGESGSVLLLILGLVVLAGLFVTVVIDVSALFLDRRDLIAAADGAALAGAQGIDQESVYRDGLPPSGPVTLDHARAVALVHDYLSDQGVIDRFRDLEVGIDVTATRVTVTLEAHVALPVANAIASGGGSGIEVDAQATAHSAVIP